MNIRAFSQLGNQALLRRLDEELAHQHVSTATLLALIAEVDERLLYLPAGYASMYAYCVHKLRLSSQAALKRIKAARAAQQFEAILDAVAEGRLHLTGVVMLAPHLTPENAGELLAAATHQTKAEIERLLAQRFPLPDVPTRVEALVPPLTLGTEPSAGNVQEQSKPLAPGRVESSAPWPKVAPLSAERFALQVTIGASTHDKMRYAQALLGHAVPAGDVAEVLDRALDALIVQLEKRKFAATSRPRHGRSSANPRHIPASVKRTVWERDGGQCAFVSDSGQRCPERTRLEYDHADPVARGGEATVEGVRLRCASHNQYEAECVFGAGFMGEKRAEGAAARTRAAEERAQAAAARAFATEARAKTRAAETEARAQATAERSRAAETRATTRAAEMEARSQAAAGRARAEAAERDPERSVVPWLRQLEVRLEDARRAAAYCECISDAPLEQRVKMALGYLATSRGRVVRPVGTAA